MSFSLSVCLARVVAGFYSHPVIFFSLLLINITPLLPPLFLHQARPSIHAQIKPENYLVQMGQTRKRQKCRHFPEEEKKQCEIWQSRKCLDFSFLETLECWWKKILWNLDQIIYLYEKLNFVKSESIYFCTRNSRGKKFLFFFYREGWPPMLLTPVDNIITGKSTFLFGYVKSAKLDL